MESRNGFLATRAGNRTKLFKVGIGGEGQAREKAVLWADGESDADVDTDEEGPVESSNDALAYDAAVAPSSIPAAVAADDVSVPTSSSFSSDSDS